MAECFLGGIGDGLTVVSGAFSAIVNSDSVAVNLGKRPKLLLCSDSQYGETPSVGTSQLAVVRSNGNLTWILVVTDTGFTAKLTIWGAGNTDTFTAYYWAIM